ncbi:MAG: MotA/TolQ/ExbB proton channel family protein [bacterium]
MLELFAKGGWAMWLLLISSVVGVATIFERLIVLNLVSKKQKGFISDFVNSFSEEDKGKKALEVCRSYNTALSRIVASLINQNNKYSDLEQEEKKFALEDAVNLSAIRELETLDKGLDVLAAVSTIAPLIGFLGTVVGMMMAFDSIAKAATVDPVLVASGIQVALITTATGLLIAFPVSAFHVYFTSRINEITKDVEYISVKVIDFLLGRARANELQKAI